MRQMMGGLVYWNLPEGIDTDRLVRFSSISPSLSLSLAVCSINGLDKFPVVDSRPKPPTETQAQPRVFSKALWSVVRVDYVLCATVVHDSAFELLRFQCQNLAVTMAREPARWSTNREWRDGRKIQRLEFLINQHLMFGICSYLLMPPSQHDDQWIQWMA